jgi:hypothetical protein
MSHVFFFDVRNTLGVVDRKGHLVQFRPSTGDLLKTMKSLEGARLAVITNTPPGVEAIDMLKGAGLDGDAVVCGMMERLGPPDITLHYDMIQGMEKDLGVMPQ